MRSPLHILLMVALTLIALPGKALAEIRRPNQFPAWLTPEAAASCDGVFAWSPEGSRLAYGDPRGGVWLVEGPKFAAPRHLLETGAPISSITWAPDGASLVVVDKDGVLRVLHAPDFSAARRVTGAHPSVSTVLWSPDGLGLVFKAERPGDLRPDPAWDSIWLVGLQGNSRERDLLPPGSPFQRPGRRSLMDLGWLDNDRVFFSMHCGTGCVAHYAIATGGSYQIICIGRGPMFWSPDGGTAVVENDSSGPDPQGLGLVEASGFRRLREDEALFQYDQACKSVFQGFERRPGVTDPGEFPCFDAWFRDSRRVVYTDLNGRTLRVWDTRTGLRTTALSQAEGGVLSPDGKRIAAVIRGRPQIDRESRLQGGDGRPDTRNLVVIDARSRTLLGIAASDARGSRLDDRSPHIANPWSPDGRYAMFGSRDGTLTMMRIDRSGKVGRANAAGWDCSWSPDGKWLSVWINPADQSVARPPRTGSSGELRPVAGFGTTLAPEEMPPNSSPTPASGSSNGKLYVMRVTL